MKMSKPRYSGAMPIRQASSPLPVFFTDERVEEKALLRTVHRLPKGAWVLFRHYGMKKRERRALFARLRKIARRRGVRIVIAGPEPRRFADADGWHLSGWRGPTPRRAAPFSVSAHQMADLNAAKRSGAAMVFISPVCATRSHKDVRGLGPIAYQRMAKRAEALGMLPLPLGGMNAAQARMMKAAGYGAIDSFIEKPSRRLAHPRPLP